MIATIKYILFFSILLLSTLFKKPQKTNINDFDKKNTLPLRGFLCLLIIISHTSTTLAEQGCISWDTVGRWLNNAPFAVGMFFFISGYGLVKSYRQKGNAYLSTFFQKRFIALLPALLLISITAAIIKSYYLNWEAYRVFNPMHGTFPIEASWYVYALLILYVVFYFSYKFSPNKVIRISSVCLATAFYIFVFAVLLQWSAHWYLTTPCFVVGVVYAEYEEKVKTLMTSYRYRTLLAACTILVIFSLPAFVCQDTLLLSHAYLWVCSIIVVLAIYQVGSVQWRWLCFIGTISYEVYLIHQLIIICLEPMAKQYTIVYCIGILTCSVVTGWIFHQICQFIINAIKAHLENNQWKELAR